MHDRTCTIEGCERPARTGSADHCSAHYFRIRRTGSAGAAEVWDRKTPPCSVAGCPSLAHSHGMCRPHWDRQRVYGDPLHRHEPRTCSIPGCDEPHVARGWCSAHYQRWQNHGDPLAPMADQTGEGNPNWRGDDIGYGQAHHRVRAERGPAESQACAHACGRRAQHWAYDHRDPGEHLDPNGHSYSIDPEHYLPLCVSCHKLFDLAA